MENTSKTTELDRMVIPKTDAKQIQRAARIMGRAGLSMGVFCARCKTATETEGGGTGIALTCKCMTRILEGVWS